MAKKKPPLRTATTSPAQKTAAQQEPILDWKALLERTRPKTEGHDLARQLLDVGKAMAPAAARMFLVGEYLLEKKKEIP